MVKRGRVSQEGNCRATQGGWRIQDISKGGVRLAWGRTPLGSWGRKVCMVGGLESGHSKFLELVGAAEDYESRA